MDEPIDNSPPDNRFERHPVLAWLLAALLLLVVLELLLRVASFEPVRFASDFRLPYRYHDRWYVDFEPDQSATIRLDDGAGGQFLNFLITTNEHAFRWYDRAADWPLPAADSTRFVHTIGDSFTMGWGVNYESSYPALLQDRLPEGYTVLNLGLNGFGTVAATGKSLELASRFPPAAVVYLATANDYEDDLIAARYAGYPTIVKRLFDGLNVARRHLELPNLYYALRWWLYYRPLTEAGTQSWVDPAGSDVVQLALEGGSDPSRGVVSKRALEVFAARLAEQNVPLIVIGHGADSNAHDLVRFAREIGLPSYLVAFPAPLTLRGEGHLNRQGNARLAAFVQTRLQAVGLLGPGKVTEAESSGRLQPLGLAHGP